MKFLLDACATSRSLHTMLIDLGHDVLSGLETDPRATDEALLALANQEQRVLITEDKDFGELVFVRRLPHPCIIRFVDTFAFLAKAMASPLQAVLDHRREFLAVSHRTSARGRPSNLGLAVGLENTDGNTTQARYGFDLRLRYDAELHPNPGNPRGAKEQREARMWAGTSYLERTDQPAFSARFSLSDACPVQIFPKARQFIRAPGPKMFEHDA